MRSVMEHCVIQMEPSTERGVSNNLASAPLTILCWACGILIQVPIINNAPSPIFRCGWCGAISEAAPQGTALHRPRRGGLWRCLLRFLTRLTYVVVIFVLGLTFSIILPGVSFVLPNLCTSTASWLLHITITYVISAAVLWNYLAAVFTSPGTPRECCTGLPPPFLPEACKAATGSTNNDCGTHRGNTEGNTCSTNGGTACSTNNDGTACSTNNDDANGDIEDASSSAGAAGGGGPLDSGHDSAAQQVAGGTSDLACGAQGGEGAGGQADAGASGQADAGASGQADAGASGQADAGASGQTDVGAGSRDSEALGSDRTASEQCLAGGSGGASEEGRDKKEAAAAATVEADVMVTDGGGGPGKEACGEGCGEVQPASCPESSQAPLRDPRYEALTVPRFAYAHLRYCWACRGPQPDVARHCYACGVCVVDQDHHCPFINNCVGRANLRNFISFLSATLVAMSYCAGMSGALLWRQRQPLARSMAEAAAAAANRSISATAAMATAASSAGMEFAARASFEAGTGPAIIGLDASGGGGGAAGDGGGGLVGWLIGAGLQAMSWMDAFVSYIVIMIVRTPLHLTASAYILAASAGIFCALGVLLLQTLQHATGGCQAAAAEHVARHNVHPASDAAAEVVQTRCRRWTQQYAQLRRIFRGSRSPTGTNSTHPSTTAASSHCRSARCGSGGCDDGGDTGGLGSAWLWVWPLWGPPPGVLVGEPQTQPQTQLHDACGGSTTQAQRDCAAACQQRGSGQRGEQRLGRDLGGPARAEGQAGQGCSSLPHTCAGGAGWRGGRQPFWAGWAPGWGVKTKTH